MTARTVKARIAVAVDSEGEWKAAGCSPGPDVNDAILMDAVRDGLGPAVNIRWLTAELPVPEAAEVEAQVEECDG